MADIELQVLGRYRILKLLGSGAMGVVYQAVDPVIDRVVAIKTINLKLSREDMAEYEARFAQEIKAAGKLNHPSIVTIYDVGKTAEFAYMAMEYIDGQELKTLIRDGIQMDLVRAINIMAQVADGLAFAHSRNIIHRDVKPSNVMVADTEDGLVAKIMDFGIARMPTSAVKTMTGMILGSPRYMSPEQVVGQPLSPATDIFSLGVMLHEVITGAAPFDGPSINSIMYATVNAAAPPPSAMNAAVPAELDAIVAKAMEKSVADRFATMREFAHALHNAGRMIESGQWQPVPEAQRVKIVPPTPRPAPPLTRGAADVAAPASNRDITLSQRFDSTLGTLRLAAFTKQTGEIAEFIEQTRQQAVYTGPDDGGEPLRPPAISLDDDDDAENAKTASPIRYPLAPALLLGGLAAIVIGLSLALIVT